MLAFDEMASGVHIKLAIFYANGLKVKKTIFLLVASLYSLNAFAAYECFTKVINVLIYNDGRVNVLHSGRGDYTFICSLNSDYQGVSPTTCAMWTGMLQAIKKKDGLANFYFAGEGSCASLPTYGSAPAPWYIGDVTPQ